MRQNYLLLLAAALPLVAAPIDDAYTLAEKGRCAEAVTLFEKHYGQAASPRRVNTEWARCALKSGDKGAAMSAFERVLMFEPSDVDARMSLAELYRAQSMTSEADAMLDVLKGMSLSATQKARLETLSSQQKKGRWKGTVKTMVGYDSNVNVSPGSTVLEDYFAELDTTPADDDDALGDGYTSLSARLDYRYQIAKKEHLYLFARGDAYTMHHFSQTRYDAAVVTLQGGPGYRLNTVIAELPLEYQRVRYLNRDLFEQVGVSPGIIFALSPSMLGTAGIRYRQRSYLTAIDRSRDDRMSSLNGSLYLLNGADHLYIAFQAERFEARKSSAEHFTDKSQYRISAGTRYDIEQSATFNLDIRYRHTRYDDAADVTRGPERTDDTIEATAQLQKALSERWQALLELSYLVNDSNYAPAKYKRYGAALGLQYRY